MYPSRIVCLTEETTETLYLLGEQHRIVGISGFTVRPAQARKEKPRVSAFTSANIGKILALQPDLVLGFSDLQADICAQLVRAGVPVHVFNQRSIAQILQMIRVLGGMIGAHAKAEQLAEQLAADLAALRAVTAQFVRRPRVYFEEWDSPQISAIRWVSELIEVAGGDDCFGTRPAAARQGSHHCHGGRGGAPRPGHHLRVLVRQKIQGADGDCTAWLRPGAGGAEQCPF
jgi:iron complex transport system substrate-binding protein